MSLSERIIFNGRELARCVPASHVIDISVGSVETENIVQTRITNAGSIFSSRRDVGRVISVQVELPFEKADATINYNLLRAWAETMEPAPMYLPNNSNGYITCVLSSMTELNLSTWYMPITLTFVAYDPYFHGITRQTEVGSTPFVVSGDIPVDFKICMTVASTISSPSWLIDAISSIALSGDIGTGLLVVDTQKGCVTLSGSSIMSQLSLASRFVQLKPGIHTITGSGGIVSWMEGWR